eukprot:s7548_g1.t1
MDVPNIGALLNELGHDEAVRLLRANGLDNVADAVGAMAEPEAAEVAEPEAGFGLLLLLLAPKRAQTFGISPPHGTVGGWPLGVAQRIPDQKDALQKDCRSQEKAGCKL